MTQVRVARPQLELSPIAASLFGAMVACAVVLPLAGFRPSPAPALAAAFMGAAVCFVSLELWRQGLGSLGVLFVVGLAYYHIVIPVEYLIDPTVPMFLLHYYPSLTEQDLVGPLLATDLGLAGF